MKRPIILLGVALIAVGCAEPLTTREQVTLSGAAIGAGTGAIIGHSSGHTGAGAIIGGIAGAVGGAVIGDAMQSAEHRQAHMPPPPHVAVAPPPPQVVVAPPPPPPQVVVVAPPPVVQSAPRMVWVPEWRVYVVEGYDVAYYNDVYYYYHGERWWTSHSHAGPWTVIMTPPPMIGRLPRGHFHRHLSSAGHGWCPPEHAMHGRC